MRNRKIRNRSKSQIKNTISVLCVSMLITLTACGSSPSAAGSAGTATQPAAATSSTANNATGSEEIYWNMFGEATENAYEITYKASEIFAVSHGNSYVKTLVAVKNICPYPLELRYAKYAIYRTDGELVRLYGSDTTMFENYYPCIVQPGETGYYYGYASTNLLDGSESLYCEPNFDGNLYVMHNAGDEDPYTYHPVENVELLPYDEGLHLQLKGTVQCVAEEGADTIYLVSVGFDEKENPICFFSGSVKDVQPGESVDFFMRAELYGSLNVDDIASYSDIIAYSD